VFVYRHPLACCFSCLRKTDYSDIEEVIEFNYHHGSSHDLSTMLCQQDRVRRLELLKAATDLLDDLSDSEMDRSKRRIQSKEWLLHFGPDPFYSYIEQTDEEKFFMCFRMYPETFKYLLSRICFRIQKQDTQFRLAISVKVRLQITLRFLSSGSNFAVLEDLFKVSRKTIAKIIPDVCLAIWEELAESYIKCPSTAEEWKRVADGFESNWNYPRALGALDGKHILVQSFGNSGSAFRNYKNGFSIVLLALVDSNYSFLYVDIGTGGASNDAGVFSKSSLYSSLESGSLNLPDISTEDPLQVNYHILADDAFGLTTRLMKPYPLRNLEPAARVFNYRFSRGRRVVENAFGILASRFRVFRQPIQQKYENAVKTVQACVALHNFIMSQEESDIQLIDVLQDEIPRLQSQAGNHSGTYNARAQRDRLANYFCCEGAVDFQWQQTFRTSSR
jgi:hypothetical protein